MLYIVLNNLKIIYIADFLIIKYCFDEVAMPIHYIMLPKKIKMSY